VRLRSFDPRTFDRHVLIHQAPSSTGLIFFCIRAGRRSGCNRTEVKRDPAQFSVLPGFPCTNRYPPRLKTR
jgi:hypothetical protein